MSVAEVTEARPSIVLEYFRWPLKWQRYSRPDAPAKAIFKPGVAAVRYGNGTNQGKSQANSSRLSIAGRLDAIEGIEDLLELVVCKTGPFIVYLDDCLTTLAKHPHTSASAIGDGVGDEIGEQTAESQPIAGQDDVGTIFDDDLVAEISLLVRDGHYERPQFMSLPRPIVLHRADELKNGGEHRPHLVDILLRLRSCRSLHAFHAKGQAGKRRSKIVGDCRHHGHPI